MSRRSRSEVAAPAPRWRRALAGAVDSAPLVIYAWRAMRRRQEHGDDRREPDTVARRIANAALAPGREVVEEQLVTPGQLIAGVRTVDRHTGARLPLWRSLVAFVASVAANGVGRLVRPSAPQGRSEAERAELRAAVERIRAEHRDDPEARNAALMEHFRAHRGSPITIDPLRSLAIPLALATAQRRIRRRIAPTEVVLRSRRPDD